MSSLKTKLDQAAFAALQFSYSPYSQKKIGASLQLTNGKCYSGCNIENASYGGTVCAERVAIWKAFSENPATEKITEVVVASVEKDPWPPCGFCRQVLAEFCTPETIVRLINSDGKEVTYQFKNLFPAAFKPEHLKK
ncbi:MAG: cytidine deaminase [Bdellovibrionaceae bacterium]|nr:cytidine deaminase [Bdellovibrio sp.]